MKKNLIKILLVEDNSGDTKLIKKYLSESKKAPFEITVVKNVSHGLTVLLDKNFDVILMDLSLLAPSGLDSLYKVRDQAKRAAIILLTGVDNEETAAEALGKGAQDFLVKDQINSDLLYRAMRYAMELKQSEEALYETEEKNRKLFMTGNDTILLVDAMTLKFVDANPAASRLYGYSLDEFLNKTMGDILAKPENTLELIGENQTETPITYHKKKDGTLFPVDINTGEYVIHRRKILVTVIRDITERIRAKKEKSKLKKLLRQSHKMEAMGTLAGGIAHDFNNILYAIMGYTELSQMSLSEDSEALDNLNEIIKAGNRAKELVKQILTFSRQSESELKIVEVNLIAEEVLKLIRASLPSTIKIYHDLKSDLPVIGDPTQFHQILMNLCSNAGHAMRQNGGVLSVSLNNVELDYSFTIRHPDLMAGPYVKLSVEDTGHGIPPEVLAQIFDPFYTTKENGDGTGMGLSVVQGIVKSYGGIIDVCSQPGKGSTFTLFLPAVERRTTPDIIKEKSIPKGTGRILFIDDEDALSKSGKKSLEFLGYDVKAKTSSMEALAAFKDQPDDFDLVITDMTMPEMTGDELAREIAAIRPDIPIILCSGYSENFGEEKVNQMYVNDFLAKPIALQDLADSIRNVMAQN